MTLRSQIGLARYQPGGRLWLSALSRLSPRRWWDEVFMVAPATLLAWHRRLANRRWDYTNRRRPGHALTPAAIRELVIRIATDNPTRNTGACERTRQARPDLHGVADPARRRDRPRTPPRAQPGSSS